MRILSVSLTSALILLLLTFLPQPTRAQSASATQQLQQYLQQPAGDRGALTKQAFAAQPLTKAEAQKAAKMLRADYFAAIRPERQKEITAGEMKLGGKTMRVFHSLHGKKPATGRSLYISMHGGGGAPARINDSQWRNQQRLYRIDEGVYVAPRAPTDTWNLWHQAHIDDFFDRLIENMVAVHNVNPDRVYLLGYSAGGDGAYQLAPRMADRFAAASMMAGHPNDASPRSLRNLPFAIHVGARDAAYKRNTVAAEWGKKLDALQKEDPKGYVHHTQIHAGKGHWMDRQDAVALPWMAKFNRQPLPQRIVWRQDDVTHQRFYWLEVGAEDAKRGAEIIATRSGQTFEIESEDVSSVTLLLNDDMVDLDQPVIVKSGGKTVFEGKAPRTIASLQQSLERRSTAPLFSARVDVQLK